jgi:RNA polymerase sigma factor (sigma-70 family)
MASLARAPLPDVDECVTSFERELDFVDRALRRQGVRAADLEDLMQEVFIAMWRAWGEFDRTRPLRPWLWGIAFRVARNHLRRRWREVPAEQLDVADDRPTGEEGLAAARARALVLRALARLPEKYRTPLIRHELDGVPVNELAEQLEMPLATVYTRVRRARLAFAEVVRELHVTGPLALDLEDLLAPERNPPAASARSRAAVMARIRTTPPPPPTSALRWLAPAAAVLVLAAGLVVIRSRPAKHVVVAARPPAAVTTPPLDLDRQLIGHWRFDGPPGPLVADSSGNRRDCRVRDPDHVARLVAGHEDVGLDLAGKTWLECPLPAVASGQPTPMTVALWVNLRSYPEHHAALATRQLGTGFEDNFFLGIEQDHLRFKSHIWDGFMTPAGPLPLDRWFHVAFTHDTAGTTRLYLDGEEVGSAPGVHTDRGLVDTALTMGAGNYSRFRTSVRQRLDGALDDARIYDRALSPAELRALASR